MAKRKLEATYPGEHARAVDRRRHASLAWALQNMNERAVRSVQNSAAVIGAGSVRNALNGIAPFVAKRGQRRGRP